jgi:hypothetical protein
MSSKDEDALVYRFGDLDALSEAIVRLTTDRHLLGDMSAASLRILEECGIAASVEGLMRAVRVATPQDACT